MRYEIDPAWVKPAKFAHELFMVNLAAFHLLAGPASWIAFGGAVGLLVPVGLCTLMMLFTWRRGRALEQGAPWFVMAHWKLALRRYLPLFVAYAISAAIIGTGLLIAASATSHTQAELYLTIFERFGVMPTFITVLVVFVMESQSIYQAVRGEVSDAVVRRHPAPASLVVLTGA